MGWYDSVTRTVSSVVDDFELGLAGLRDLANRVTGLDPESHYAADVYAAQEGHPPAAKETTGLLLGAAAATGWTASSAAGGAVFNAVKAAGLGVAKAIEEHPILFSGGIALAGAGVYVAYRVLR